MAKYEKQDTIHKFEKLKNDIINHNFSPFYLLMGEEPYYPELLCNLLTENVLLPSEKDFNQTILFGSDTNVFDLISICCRFPMMAERQLVVVKEAQSMKKIEELSKYLDNIVDTTVLVLLFSGVNADKRTAIYKKGGDKGVVFESPALKDWDIPQWIENYVKSIDMSIEKQAAEMLSEFAGNDLRKIVIEIGKIIQAIDINSKSITTKDIEQNVGMSREFNLNELINAISVKNVQKVYKITHYLGESPKKYPIQMTLAYLFSFFSKVELIQAHSMAMGNCSLQDAARQAGLEYSKNPVAAASNYNIKKTMKIISILREYDIRSKSNSKGEADDGDLLTEIVSKILNC